VDSGIGLNEEHRKQLFKLFSKIEHKNKDLNKYGIGLGLAISQHLAKLMQSEGITIQSEEGKGSSFIFSLPFARNFEEEAFHLCEESKINRIPNFHTNCLVHLSKKEKILLVDDDPMSMMISEKYLQSFGLVYEKAQNGSEAIEKIRSNRRKHEYFSLIILDLYMPILNGFETAKIICEMVKAKEIPYLPIIGMSGCDKEDTNVFIKEFLKKPVFKNELKEMIKKILKINIVTKFKHKNCRFS
jgi:CheY-like chemotaxis protein